MTKASAVITRYHARCTDCPGNRPQTFYSERERNRFALQHALAHNHSVTTTEEVIPCHKM
jgi:hypothetical protein